MRKIIRLLMIFLIAYLIYAFIVSIIVYAFKNPNENKELEPSSGDSKKEARKKKDRAQLIESETDGALIRINLIENAEKNIDISYLTFRDNKISRMMLGSILDAANRGVKVRILFDSLSLLPAFHGEYKNILYGLDSHENIDLKFYNPINPLFPFTWNKRLHDKIIIVDGSLALMGGRNIADNYFKRNTKWLKFSKDRDVIIYKNDSLADYPSVIEDIRKYYNDTWNYKYSKPLIRKLNPRRKKKTDLACENLRKEHIKTKKDLKEKLNKPNWHNLTIAAENIEFVHNPVGKFNHDPWCLQKILTLASQAEESFFIQSPYVIPSRRVRYNFSEYDVDLEKAKILTNSHYSSPNHLSIAAYTNHRKEMIDNGIEIHEYQGSGSLHGKAYIFDDYISALGSFNLDPRSSYINSESMVVISSKEFTEKLKENIQVDLDQSLKIGEDYSYTLDNSVEKAKVSKVKKLIITILSKIVPAIEHML